MTRTIDLNADLGEGYGPWSMGDDETMLSLVSSASVACGGHAGDVETMFRTLTIAEQNGVTVGAHPGYVDREGFGRRIIPMSHAELGRVVAAQVGALSALAAQVPTDVRYVKLHGALGNLSALDHDVAAAIIDAVRRLDRRLAILAISGTAMEDVARSAGAKVYSEVFADRAYQPNGQLVPRGQPGAMIDDPDAASDRLVEFLETGLMPVIGGAPIPLSADSICVHGDSSHAVDMTRRVREVLVAAGITVTGLASPIS